MYFIDAYKINDVLRNRTCSSFKEAHEQYAPQIGYTTFIRMVKAGRFPFLTCYQYKKSVTNPNEGAPLKGKQIIDVDMGYAWDSVSACARYLRVSRQAVMKALKKKKFCRGHKLALADCTKR